MKSFINFTGMAALAVVMVALAASTAEASPAKKDLRASYDGCGVTKGCFGTPSRCLETRDCLAVITYAKADTGYAMEIFGVVAAGVNDVYIAGGLSFDTKMEYTSVTACRNYRGVHVDVVQAFNDKGHANHVLSDPMLGLSNVTASHVDDELYCSFTREASLEIEGLTFDLDNDVFYLEVAKGDLAITGALTHHTNKAVSPDAVSLGDFP
ncbi:putative ferric-chelate reductase 1 homolog [Hyalella azteca]|uniref:Ferric-chelate reductase 1 homolog n=1 Tax=Hyalella azteca TaxID=294128 RepID=A0A8B7PDQ3_HYAAZ|nr:putative ferric-chelate reductase 1 homolog [Hyalella azteca]